MTREEAIRIFQRWIDWNSELQYADREENIELYKMAIQALKQMSVIEKIKTEIMALEPQYPIDDNTPYISSQSVWKIINKFISADKEN